MKKGAADDPFAEDESDDNDAEASEEAGSMGDLEEGADDGTDTEAEADTDRVEGEHVRDDEATPADSVGNELPKPDGVAIDGPVGANGKSNRQHDSEAKAESGMESEATDSASTASTAGRAIDGLPYLPQRQLRGRSVKDGRHQVPFFLRPEVQRGERDLMRAVEVELDTGVNKTDLREAAYVFAQRHPEHVAAMLREWGIDYLD